MQPGWQVLVPGDPARAPADRGGVRADRTHGAYPLLQLVFELIGGPFAREAPLELLRETAPLQQRIWRECDAMITIWAPENAREGSDLSEERRRRCAADDRAAARADDGDADPVGDRRVPGQATAEEAGMTLAESRSSSSAPCCSTGTPRRERMRRIADVFDAADEVRIVGAGTDLTLSLAGRTGAVDDGHMNMPGGEVFYSPVEDSAEGVIDVLRVPGRRTSATRSRARGSSSRAGRIVDASARER